MERHDGKLLDRLSHPAAHHPAQNRLVRAPDFRAVRPPPACSALANTYFTYLSDYAATISKLQAALLNGDVSTAMGAQGAQQQINADAQAADGQLGQLCGGFGVPKPFSIQPEGGSSPLTGL